MQNPFIQLKKYEGGLCEAKENRATERLAACLILSVEIRREFLNFLFKGERCFDTINALAYEVSTQQRTTDGDWVDLLIEKENEESIVVEVKVGCCEDSDQIRKYVKWLKTTKGKYYVFHLVQIHDPTFKITDYGGHGHHRWEELHKYLSRSKKPNPETTDERIAEQFCDYLELEGIVSPWNPKQILDYRPGLAASRALQGLFKQVDQRLKDLNLDYETKIIIDDEDLPRLEVGRTSWKSIFGQKGDLKRIHALYAGTDKWKYTPEQFNFEIKVWDQWRGCDWDFTKPKLSHWLRVLKENNYSDRWAVFRNNKNLEEVIDTYSFNEPLKQIVAAGDAPTVVKDIETMESDVLVGRIYSEVLNCCNLISQFNQVVSPISPNAPHRK